MKQIHTCVRVRDIDASIRFYEALGFEKRGKLQFKTAYNIYMGLPGDGDTLELTVNEGRTEPYDLGDGYNHIAITVDNIHATVSKLAEQGIEPEKPPTTRATGPSSARSASSRIRMAIASRSSTAAPSRPRRTGSR